MRRVVVGDHRLRAAGGAPSRACIGAQTMPLVWRTMKAELLRRGVDGGEDQVALVLAVVVVGDDDDLAALEGGDGVGDAVAVGRSSVVRSQPTWPRWRR